MSGAVFGRGLVVGRIARKPVANICSAERTEQVVFRCSFSFVLAPDSAQLHHQTMILHDIDPGARELLRRIVVSDSELKPD